jgi:Tc toxin complex TcA C-terminal TcB-binding domain
MPERGFHETGGGATAPGGPDTEPDGNDPTRFTYAFRNFFHPFVGELIERLNRTSVDGLLDPVYHESLRTAFFTDHYTPLDPDAISFSDKEIDVAIGGPYATYNWELFFHVPVAVAVHLSNNQRFAEAQRWFHRVFDPTENDTSVAAPERYWRFLRFRQDTDVQNIDDLLRLLSDPHPTPDEQDTIRHVLEGYASIRNHPFQPHRVAATRTSAYQYHVVMRYLDNLIAWGDTLFREDTAEAITEATQRYVLAANILGPRPERLPRRGTRRATTYAALKAKLNETGNALVELESQFPFNLAPPPPASAGTQGPAPSIGQTLFFCVPRNTRLLGYWDTVADRLTKIRSCRNLDGVERRLALFEPALDPGMLVKAVAAGVSPSAAAADAVAPVGPLRAAFLLEHARALVDEVRSLGANLLGAIEKGDAEALTQLRQEHETALHTSAREVRFLQWRQAQASTDALLHTRNAALERYRYYRRMLGYGPGSPGSIRIPRPTTPDEPLVLTEAGFDAAYTKLVLDFEKQTPGLEGFPQLKLAGSSPATAGGLADLGRLNLNLNEDEELNTLLPRARDLNLASSVVDTVASVLNLIPDLNIDLMFWGLGMHSHLIGGTKLAEVSRIAASIIRTTSTWQTDQAGMASRNASYERRADDWRLQHNLATHEVRQLGRQLLTAVVAEQAAQREYGTARQTLAQDAEVAAHLRGKVTNTELYASLQGELTRLYHESYRFALDVARKAEQAVKRELLADDVTNTTWIGGTHWAPGRRGLLAGEALAADLRRLSLAYRENRRREYELVRHVSLAQLDPLALLQLKATGSCEVSVPEAFYDIACPGHYLRRIRQVSVSIPAVTGPYTGVSCTLTLLRSAVRTRPGGADYARRPGDDDRFADYVGATTSIVTSTGREDAGLFEPGEHDERFLPFESAGAVSSWRLQLPERYRQFDYDTIPDVVLHVRYTAREGGAALRKAAEDNLDDLVAAATATGTTRLVSVRQEFPVEWARLVGTAASTRPRLELPLRRELYPYWAEGLAKTVKGIEVLARPSDPSVGTLEVFAGPDAGAASDRLTADPMLGDLLRGALAHVPVPTATGTLVLHPATSALDNLWLLLTWSAK